MSKAISWGAKVPDSAWPVMIGIQQRIGLDPDNLCTCMMFESGMNPAAKNPSSSASGLIQFMDSTAARFGTSTAALRAMDFKNQLRYVEAYFHGFMIHGHTLADWSLNDTYMAILWPAAIGKPGSYVMFVNDLRKNHDAYDVNSGLDLNRDGQITKQEVCAKIQKLYQEGLKPGNLRMI